MTNQPEALRLADWLESELPLGWMVKERAAAAELRRLHALNQELLETLNYWFPFIESEQDDERQAPWVEKARAVIAKAEGEKQ